MCGILWLLTLNLIVVEIVSNLVPETCSQGSCATVIGCCFKVFKCYLCSCCYEDSGKQGSWSGQETGVIVARVRISSRFIQAVKVGVFNMFEMTFWHPRIRKSYGLKLHKCSPFSSWPTAWGCDLTMAVFEALFSWNNIFQLNSRTVCVCMRGIVVLMIVILGMLN